MTKNYWMGENILLRAPEEADIAYIVESRNTLDHEAYWLYDKIYMPESEGGIRKIYEDFTAENKDDKRFLVIETLEGEYAGHIYVWHTQKRERLFRYGVLIEEQFQGRGLAAEALVILLDYYFNELNYNKCAPTVYEYNKPSQAFHEKFGFIREGALRGEVYSRGKYWDMIYYGMLKDEFNARYQHFAQM